MDDLTTYALLATSFFFVALSVGLLVRYREVSQKINASTDLGHDLWQALQQRLAKQDERVLDMMGRVEVLQSRSMADPPARVPPPVPSTPPPAPATASSEEKPSDVTKLRAVASMSESRGSLDETEIEAIKLLGQGPMSTIQIKEALERSREHTARLMKGLFDRGLVVRDDSTKPFVYQLTDEGRRHLR
jgi:CRP-like cAMP-binding protein